MSRAVSVVLAAGGSGGHIQPALACAAAIGLAEPTAAISVLGSVRGLEGRVVPASGWELDTVPAVPLPRRPGVDLVALTPRLLTAVRAAGRVLRRRRADVVVGFGGYAALPGYLAARRAGIPIVVHEANPVPGIANRIGARLTTHVFTAGMPIEPGSSAALRHAVGIGMPVRAQITGLDRLTRRPAAAAAFGLDPDRPTLVVTGGSQGARRLNEAVLGAAERLSAAGIGVLHLLGPDNPLPDAAHTPEGYVAVGYVEAMEDVYAVADLVLCRAGMTTVAELATLGLPAVFVPLPFGNGEQRRNAEALVTAGAAVVVEDGELTADRVAALVPGLLTDPYRLTAMAAAVRAAGAAAGHRDAASALAAAVLQVARAHADRSAR